MKLPAGQPEKHKWYKEHHTNGAAQKPVSPFPPIDEPELVEAHALVDEMVFWNLAVFFECRQPVGFIERRDGPQQWLPFGDGQA